MPKDGNIVAEILSAFVDLGWLILASFVLLFLFPSIKQKLESVYRVTLDKSGKVTLDIKQQIQEELATQEVEAQQEAFSPEELKSIGKRIVIWSTGGDRRPAGPIAVLQSAGFRVEEVEPSRLFGSGLLEQKDVAAIVTNLKHGSDYNGGLAMVTELRSKSYDLPVVLYTSKSAVARRESHIAKIHPNFVAVDSAELVEKVAEASNS